MEKIDLSNWEKRHLTDNEVAALLSVSRATVWRWAAAGRIPNPHRWGENVTRWDGAYLAKVLSEQTSLPPKTNPNPKSRAKQKAV